MTDLDPAPPRHPDEDLILRPRMSSRRTFVRAVTAGTVLAALGGGLYIVLPDAETRRARRMKLADGRPRLPPNQYLLQRLKPMGGREGDPSPGAWRLKVHGEVEHPFEIDFAGLLKLPQVHQTCDVHCVTKWSLFDSHWQGVRVSELARKAKVKPSAHYVIFEAAHGYTSNISLHDALRPDVLVAHRYEGNALPTAHGAPARALVPERYFWKSAKWLTGIYFSAVDQPGYWETRGYNNHADPWKEERYS